MLKYLIFFISYYKINEIFKCRKTSYIIAGMLYIFISMYQDIIKIYIMTKVELEMTKTKRKIYKINLWLYSEDVVVDIEEYTIKRKCKSSIKTYEGTELYTYNYNIPSCGTIIGESAIHVSMVTEDFTNINSSIEKMIEEGRKRINLEIKLLNDMDKQLDLLEKFDKGITFVTNKKGFYHVEKVESDMILKPFNKGKEPISIKNYVVLGK